MISCPVVAAGSSNASGMGCGAEYAYSDTLFNLQLVHVENVWNLNSLACFYVVAVLKLGVVSTLEMPSVLKQFMLSCFQRINVCLLALK